MKFRQFLAVPVIAAAAMLASCGGSKDASSGSPAAPVKAVPAPAGKSWLETVSTTPEGGVVMGNPNAPIKLVEYGSRTCPVCGEFGRTGTQPLEKEYVATGKLSWEFREYLVHGQPDIPAALLGKCVPIENFFPILEQMYINQGPVEEKMGSPEGQALFQKFANSQKPIEAAVPWAQLLGYIDFFKQRGLPEAKVQSCLADAALLDRITKGMTDANDKGVRGTPAFFINGDQVDAITWPQLEAALKAHGG